MEYCHDCRLAKTFHFYLLCKIFILHDALKSYLMSVQHFKFRHSVELHGCQIEYVDLKF